MIPNKGVYRGEGSKGTALPPRPVKGGGIAPLELRAITLLKQKSKGYKKKLVCCFFC